MRIAAVSSSALLRNVARALSCVRTQVRFDQMPLGLGGDSEHDSRVLVTPWCPSDSAPVALGLTIDGIGCSCSPRYPTPTASDWKGSTGKGSRRGTLAERLAMECGASGKTTSPHPEFVEALMGFPIGWSDCVDSVTPSLPSWPSGSEHV
jgi:hypothetical protein